MAKPKNSSIKGKQAEPVTQSNIKVAIEAISVAQECVSVFMRERTARGLSCNTLSMIHRDLQGSARKLSVYDQD